MKAPRLQAKSRAARAGFTLIEAMIVVALLGVGISKLAIVMQAASASQASEGTQMDLQNRAERALDQIAYAVMSSDRNTLQPDPESPNHSAELSFMVSLGVENGETVWSDPEMVQLSDVGGQVLYRQNPDEDDELRVVWCNLVRPYLDGEFANDEDDNGNGLADEFGLSFELDGDAVNIRLTLEKTNSDGEDIAIYVETTVTCRN